MIKSEKKRFIYARMGVQLLSSRRAYRAEKLCDGAMGLYAFALMYARHDLDAEKPPGFVPEEVLLSAWGRPESVREPQAEALVCVDLLERVEGGFVVIKYAEHNDTAEDVESNRASARERMRAVRANIDRTNSERSGRVRRTEGERSPDVPISISISEIRSGDPDSEDSARVEPTGQSENLGSAPFGPERASEVREAPEVASSSERPAAPNVVAGNGTHASDLTAAPAWWEDVCETVESNTGEKLRRPEAWIRYSGHRHGKRLAPNARDAGYWLATVMVREARDERHKATTERDRQRARAGPVTPAESQFTPEEIAEQVRRHPVIVRKKVSA